MRFRIIFLLPVESGACRWELLLATTGTFSSTQEFIAGTSHRTRPFVSSNSHQDDQPAKEYLMQQAETHAQADQVLAAARCLRKAISQDSELILDEPLQKILDVASRVEETIMELSSPPDPKIWIKQGEVHDEKRDMTIHYKLDRHRRLTSRIELLIDKSLLKPLSSVLIETDLYNTWVPRWRFPPVGVANVRKVGQTGRTNQILHVELDIPMRRDLIIASNGVEDVDKNGLLAIHLGTYPAGEEIATGLVIPSPEHGVKRVDFEGCFVFQKCPVGHPLLARVESRKDRDAQSNPADLILVSFSMFADAKISSLFPQWIVNFILRVAIAKIFIIFLTVAEDIQGGKRPDHSAAIDKKRDEIYDWMDERIETMVET